MTDLLLVDDHTSFREALAFMLDREPDLSVVAQAGSAGEARSTSDCPTATEPIWSSRCASGCRARGSSC